MHSRPTRRALVAATLLSLGAVAARADVGTQPDVMRPAIGAEREPLVVAVGSGFVAVWIDSAPAPYAGWRLVASRLDARGDALDAPGVVVAADVNAYERPALGVCDGHVIVAWTGSMPLRSAVTGVYTSELALPAAGSLTASAPQPLPAPTNPGAAQRAPAFASAGDQCLLVYMEGALEVATRFVTAPLDTPALSLGTAELGVQAAWDGTRYAIAWQDGGIRGIHVTHGGVADPAPATWQPATADVFALEAAAGTTYLAWSDGAAVRGQRLDGTGSPLEPVQTLSTSAGALRSLAITPFQGGFAVLGSTRTAPYQLLVTGVGANGSVTQPTRSLPLVTSANRLGKVAIAAAGTTTLALFGEQPRPVDGDDILALPLDATLAPTASAGNVVSLAAAAQRTPRAAASGTTGLLAWTEARWEDRGTSYSYVDTVIAARVDARGRVLDPLGLEVSSGANSYRVGDVDATGSDFLVTWVEGPGDVVWVRRYDAATGLASAARQVPATDALDTSVAWNGSHHLLVVRGSHAASAWLLDASGAVTSGPIALPSAFDGLDGSHVVVSANGGGWLLARTAGATLYVLPLDASGQPLVADPVKRTNRDSIVEETPPALASDGTRALVAWNVPDSGDCNLRGELFDAAGTSLGTAQLARDCVLDGMAAGFDGTDWVVARRDTELVTGLETQHFDAALAPLSPPVSVADTTGPHSYPVLAAMAEGRFLLGFVRRIDAAPFGTWRVRGQIIPSPLPDPGPADAGTTLDAGTVEESRDAGSTADVDAGVPSAADGGDSSTRVPGGCGCGSGDGSELALLAAAGLLATRARRKR